MEEYFKKVVKERSQYLSFNKIDISDIKLETRARLQCFHCKNYHNKWTCPPMIPNLDYMKLFMEYENAAIVYCRIPFETAEEFNIIRVESTNLLHHALLELEEILYKNNKPMAVSFIGGSCKLCKDGCNKEKCQQPDLARIPLEGTGVNVIRLIKETMNIDLVFPPADYLYRVGLLLW
ncbi:MAG: DUF2284 domain-containing protein [Sedimentibacter sp.]|uniref:DUF2284 domain-containing protein n=1 Tax=Sedimentibacter sp. TaxID=1960295 RepID=UPI003159407F